MIRVVVLDRHPATCAGVNAILNEHAGVVGVGSATDRQGLWPLLYRTDPDVVVVDDLRLCPAVRARHPQVRVVLHAAGAGFAMIVPAAFAGADAIVDKTCSPHELVAAIRGDNGLPVITPRLQRQAAGRLGGTDRAILAMRLAGTPDREIAATVGLHPRALAARTAAIAGALSGAAVAAFDDASELHAG
jgi:DNA-binding NarL/FixJ family response regulator